MSNGGYIFVQHKYSIIHRDDNIVSAFAAKIPNILSVSRIFLSLAMLFVEPLSDVFLILLGTAFLTDVLDGYLARKWHVESKLGSHIDSIADFMMMVILIVVLIITLEFKDWMLIILAVVLIVRTTAFVIGALRFKQLAFVHTWLNKLTTMLIVLSPFFVRALGLDISVIIVGGVAMAAAIEYLYISITSKEYDPDRKSAFF